MFDRYKQVILFDVETSGLDPKKDKIIELGMLVLRRNDINDKFKLEKEVNSLLKHEDLVISEEITKITGITQQAIDEQGVAPNKVFDEIAGNFLVYQEDTLLVAYNAGFDINFISEFLSLHMIKTGGFPCLVSDILDPLTIFRDRHSGSHKLKDAIAFYGAEGVNSHRAIDDVKAMLSVIKKMWVEDKGIDLYINHLGYNPYYGVSNRVPRIHYIGQEGGGLEVINHIKCTFAEYAN